MRARAPAIPAPKINEADRVNDPPHLANAFFDFLLARLIDASSQSRLMARGGVAMKHALLHSLVDFRNRLWQKIRCGLAALIQRSAKLFYRSAQTGAIAAVDDAATLCLPHPLFC